MSLGGTVMAADYIMSPGDQMDVLVQNNPDLSTDPASPTNKYIVRPDSKVAFPLIGEVDVTGLTIPKFTALLQERYAKYLINPQITVSLAKLGTTRVFVFGEVHKPGMYELEKSHRVMDAIGIAEGFTWDTAKKKVYLIRDAANVKSTKDFKPIMVNFNDLLTKGDLNQNYELHEGDALYLTRNGRIDFARDIAPFFSAAYMVSEISKNN
jgi:polysaccharide export outer membrane protein